MNRAIEAAFNELEEALQASNRPWLYALRSGASKALRMPAVLLRRGSYILRQRLRRTPTVTVYDSFRGAVRLAQDRNTLRALEESYLGHPDLAEWEQEALSRLVDERVNTLNRRELQRESLELAHVLLTASKEAGK